MACNADKGRQYNDWYTLFAVMSRRAYGVGLQQSLGGVCTNILSDISDNILETLQRVTCVHCNFCFSNPSLTLCSDEAYILYIFL